MIKNDRQYRITKAQAASFDRALKQLQGSSREDVSVHPLIAKAQVDAVQSQLDELRAELAEYDAVRAGIHAVPSLASFIDLPTFLIQARIARGLSQKELAERLNLKMQQIQRYEATNYEGASFARIKEVIQALQVEDDAAALNRMSGWSLKSLQQRLSEVGFDRSFIQKRLMPAAPIANASSAVESGGALVLGVAERAARALQVPTEQLLAPTAPDLGSAAVAGVRFKLPARVNEQRLVAYARYAEHLARSLLEATSGQGQLPIPQDAPALRHHIVQKYGVIDFETIVHTIWDFGVPVLPLRDPGAFHGACWRVSGRNVIALKQMTRTTARWSFDVLHEFRHAGQHPEQESLISIEVDEDADRLRAPDEIDASEFAGAVLLGDDADDLAHRVVGLAHSNIRHLKTVVPAVAAQQGVPTGVLANYMAFRLSLENENWWPTATTLQAGGPDPWLIARDVLLERVEFGQLGDLDRDLLVRALTEDGEV